MPTASVLRVSILVAATVLCGCASLGYSGSATALSSDQLRSESGWLAIQDVPVLRQHTEHDCGITALEMVLRHWGRRSGAWPDPRPEAEASRWSAVELRDLARAQGLQAFVVRGMVEDLAHELKSGRPVIVGTAKPTITGERAAHYEVVVGVHPQSRRIATLDPARGLQQNSLAGFLDEWTATGAMMLVVLGA